MTVRPQPRSFASDFIAVASGTVIGQALQAVLTPLVGRAYGPYNFGLWSLVLSAASFPMALGGLRYELGIVISDSDEEAANVAALQLALALLVAALSLVAVVSFGNTIATALGNAALSPWLYAVPVIAMASAISQCSTYWLMRRHQFRWLSLARGCQSAAPTIIQVLLLVTAAGAFGIVSGGVVGLCVPCLLFLAWIFVWDRHTLREVSLSQMWRAAQKHRQFPLFIVPYGFAGIVRERGILFLIGAIGGTASVGWYALATRLAFVPTTMLSGTVSPVLYRRVAAEQESDKAEALVTSTLAWMSVCAVPVLMFVAWYADRIVLLLLGKDWRFSSAYVSVLALPAALALLSGTVDRLMDLVNRQKWAFGIEAVFTVTAVSLASIAVAVKRDPLTAVTVFAIVSCVYHVGWLYAVYSLCGYGNRAFWKLCRVWLALFSASNLIFWACSSALMGPAAFWLSGALVGAYYMGGALFFLKYRRLPTLGPAMRWATGIAIN